MAPQLQVPTVAAIAADIESEHPEWCREQVYTEVHRRYPVRMREYTGAVVRLSQNDAGVMRATRIKVAEAEARRTMRRAPNITLLLNRKRDEYVKAGATLEDAVIRAHEETTEETRAWSQEMTERTQAVLTRDAAKPITLTEPKPLATPAPKGPIELSIPLGMSRAQAIDAAQRGHLLPMRREPNAERNKRLAERTREVQARGGDFADYTNAYVIAMREIGAEDRRYETRLAFVMKAGVTDPERAASETRRLLREEDERATTAKKAASR